MDAVLAPLKAAAETARATAKAAADADRCLVHVYDYITRPDALEPGHFDGFLDRQRFAKDVAEEVRPLLIERLREQPLDQRAVYQLIEELVDAKLDNR